MMSMVKKAVFLVLLSILLPTVFLVTSFAHGDEDHGEKRAVVTTDQMNIKVAESEAVEVVVKYPTPKPAEEIALLVFLTDLKTNAPVEATTLGLTINQVESNQPSKGNSGIVQAVPRTLAAAASPTDTPGVYEAKVTFPEIGEYNLTLKLRGHNLASEMTIAGIVVPGDEAQAEETAPPGRNRLPLAIAASVLFILAGAMSFFFWLRPRRIARAAEAKPIYTTVEEYEP